MELVFFWFLFSVVVAIVAGSRGRSAIGWWLLSSPLLGLILVALMASLKVVAATLGEAAPTPETHVKCPDCRELILKDARVCKHCGCRLVPQA